MIVELTPHSIARFIERCRPGLDSVRAEDELVRLLAEHGEVAGTAPAWLTNADAYETDFWILLSDDFAIPVLRGRALTFLARWSALPERRRGMPPPTLRVINRAAERRWSWEEEVA